MRSIVKLIFFVAVPFVFQSCLKNDVDQDSVEYAKNDKEVKDFTDKLGGFSTLQYESYTMYQRSPPVYTNDHIDSTSTPTVGSQITVSFIGKLVSDTTKHFSDFSKPGLSYYFAIGGGVIPGFELGVRHMKKGQTQQFVMPSSLGFGSSISKDTASGNVVVPAYSSLFFDQVKLLDIRTEAQVLKAYAKMLLTKDANNIIIDTIGVGTGIYYVRNGKAADGNPITNGQTVTVDYVGIIAGNGSTFDPSPKSNPKKPFSSITFTVGPDSGLITGFNDGIKLMRAGESGYIFLPSSTAYSSKGSGSIPGYTPLVFKISSIKKIQ